MKTPSQTGGDKAIRCMERRNKDRSLPGWIYRGLDRLEDRSAIIKGGLGVDWGRSTTAWQKNNSQFGFGVGYQICRGIYSQLQF